MTRAADFDRAKGRTCIATIPMRGNAVLCVDLFVDRGPPTVCVRLYRRTNHELPVPGPYRITFDARSLQPLIDALSAVQRILGSASPLSDRAPDPAREPFPQESPA